MAQSSSPSNVVSFAQKTAQKVAQTRVPKPVAPSPSNVLPEGGQSWGDYWTAVTGMGLLLFIIYLAANGQLQTWFNLFIFSPASSIAPQGAAAATTAAVPGATTGSGIGAAAAATAGAAIAQSGNYSSFLQQFTKALGF